MGKFDLRLFMNAVDFFQNGGAGWKHARRSDRGGWNESRSYYAFIYVIITLVY
jgi:hypothetical protein